MAAQMWRRSGLSSAADECSSLATYWKMPTCNHTAITRQSHGNHTAITRQSLQSHGNRIAITRHTHDDRIVFVQRAHDNRTAIAWQSHDNHMAIAWQSRIGRCPPAAPGAPPSRREPKSGGGARGHVAGATVTAAPVTGGRRGGDGG
eukprot:1765620-Prymnesium_polylepis.1